jgi:hypothetical protein
MPSQHTLARQSAARAQALAEGLGPGPGVEGGEGAPARAGKGVAGPGGDWPAGVRGLQEGASSRGDERGQSCLEEDGDQQAGGWT